jgi:hypothetical protein
MDTRNTRRYLRFAFGEIILVVIGILIALQINNWNEWRKDRIQEREVLENLAESLESNTIELQGLIRINERCTQASELILNVLDEKLPMVDSLKNYFGYALNIEDSGDQLSLVGYESFKNSGLDIILNKELKKEIILLYEDTFNQTRGRLNRNGKMYVEIIKLRQDRFLRLPGFNFTPFDFKQLREDQYFYSWLLTVADNRSWATVSIRKSLSETKRVLSLINEELAKTNK